MHLAPRADDAAESSATIVVAGTVLTRERIENDARVHDVTVAARAPRGATIVGMSGKALDPRLAKHCTGRHRAGNNRCSTARNLPLYRVRR